MPSAFRGKLEQDRLRNGLSVPRLAWMLGVSVREYREIVEGEAWPSADVWERIEEFSVATTIASRRAVVGQFDPPY